LHLTREHEAATAVHGEAADERAEGLIRERGRRLGPIHVEATDDTGVLSVPESRDALQHRECVTKLALELLELPLVDARIGVKPR
jgi:hypothetical protein